MTLERAAVLLNVEYNELHWEEGIACDPVSGTEFAAYKIYFRPGMNLQEKKQAMIDYFTFELELLKRDGIK